MNKVLNSLRIPTPEIFKTRASRISLIVLVALIATLLGLGLRQMRSDSQHMLAIPPAPDKSQLLAVQQIVAPVVQIVHDDFSDYTTGTNPWLAENTSLGSAISVAGYPFRIASASEVVLSIVPAHPVENLSDTGSTFIPEHPTSMIYGQIAALLASKGFHEQPLAPAAQYTFAAAPILHTLTHSGVTCTILEYPTNYSLNMTCGDAGAANYLAAQMKPFATLYAAGGHISLKDVVIGPVSIKSQDPDMSGPIIASKSPGYDLAEAIIQVKGNKQIALYYAKNSVWHYITTHSDEWGFDCTPILSNPDARKAMYDQVCYDYKGARQIRVDSTDRALP